MSATAIEWTDRVWNFLRGCSRVSEGCRNCYAERLAIRMSGPGGAYEGLVRNTSQGPRWTGKIAAARDKLDEPKHWREPAMVFVNSMSDLFHPEVMGDTALRATVVEALGVMGSTPRHTYQVLTKRPAEAREFFVGGGVWMRTLPNLWVGASVEDQESHDLRVGPLREIPAAVHFLSVEPLLGPIQLDLRGIEWVIVGGESGPFARPMHPDWVRSIRDQCAAAGVALFFKQWGKWAPLWEARKDPDHRAVPQDARDGQRELVRTLNLAGGHGFHGDRVVKMANVGKKHSGRELDGRTHDGFPNLLVCSECNGRGWHVGEAHPQEMCGRCDGSTMEVTRAAG